MGLNFHELAQFLVEAKKSTYASGGVQTKGADKSKSFQFRKGKYLYRDRYFGSERFGGEEIVWCEEEPAWLMNYNGRITKKILDRETVFAFLRQALLQVLVEKPFRGPLSFRRDDFEYRNSVSGEITWFKGTEEILYQGETVYKVEYSGGVIK